MATRKQAKRKPNIFVDLSKQGLAEREKMMLNDFKNFNTDALELDQLIALAAFGRAQRAEYEAQRVPEPEYVAEQLNTLRREIETRLSDRREARKREIKAQLDSLQTQAERRAHLEKELAELGAV